MKTLVHTEQTFIEEVIHKAEICHVGMVDMDNTPYVIPMNFGYQDGTLYLHSAQEGRSISILEQNPRVCITFSIDHQLAFQHPDVACSYTMKSKSVIGWGNVEFEEDLNRKVEILNIIMKHYTNKEFKYGEPALRHVKVWKIPFDKITCKEFGSRHYR